MTMHLAHPALSTTGKKRGKKKWASAEQKRKFEYQQAEWQALLARHNIPKNTAKVTAKTATGNLSDSYRFSVPPGREVPKIASKDTGWVPCTRGEDKVYTGTKVKGSGTMHKSNAVPIFSDDEAIEISKMRR